MADVSIFSPGCSLKPPRITDMSMIDEVNTSMSTPSQVSTVDFTASPINAHKVIAELVGTYVIIFIGCGSVIQEGRHQLNSIGVALAWVLVVMVMIYSFGHVSGAHFNPAATIAFAASFKFPWKQVPGYVASQLAGSTFAIHTLDVMFDSEKININTTLTQNRIPVTKLEAFIWEFIISFVLMLAICCVAIESRAINELSGVTEGAAFLCNMLIAGNMTGASRNPARSIGPAIVSKDFKCLWIYIFAPVLGMISATTMYGFISRPTSENFGKENTNNVRVIILFRNWICQT